MTDIIFKLLTSSLINCTKDGILDEKIPTAKEFLQRNLLIFSFLKMLIHFSIQGLELPFIIPLIIGTILSLATIVMGILHFVHVGKSLYWRFYGWVKLNVNHVLGFYVTNVYRRTFILYLAGTAPFISSFALSSMYMPRISFLSHLLSFLWVSLDLLLDDLIGKRNLQLFFNCPLRHNLPPSAHCWRQTVNCTKNEPNLVTHHIPNTALLLCISMPPQITDGNAKD